MAQIALEGMRFYAYHGFYEEERKTGGHYVVDVYMKTALPRTAYQDELYATINYETVHFICKAAMKKPTKLIESVAARIIVGIKKQFDELDSVRVRIKKENPPLGGEVGCASVELDDDFAPHCGRCNKPLVCFDKPEGCWCTQRRIDSKKLARFQSQFYKCKCLDCPLN
ncbi:MAG: dihydroneopterin aldolase [Bacteroidota bacterium]